MEGEVKMIPIGVAARRLGVSNMRVRQLADEGRLGPVTRGPYGIRLIRQDAVADMAREREERHHGKPR